MVLAAAAWLLAASVSGCGNTIATPLPTPVTAERTQTAAEKAQLKRELADLEKKKATHQQDAIKAIEGSR